MVENALAQIAGTPVSCRGAGRTDTGVHATGQVIAWDMNWAHPPRQLLKAINHYLPPEIALQSIGVVDTNFHPRHDAVSRTYLYRIYIAPARDPLRDAFVWQREHPLDVRNMQTALQQLVGVHDFATFGQPTVGTVTIRHMLNVMLHENGDELHITLCANGFLKRMVRSIVGTLVEVGRNKMSLREFEAAFKAADRRLSGPSAPPRGLVLTTVTYEHGWLEQLESKP
jgi:tRNA pseudouridine38-40 synthase